MKIFVGIDIAKLNHFAAAISSDGEILIEPFKFTNDYVSNSLSAYMHFFRNSYISSHAGRLKRIKEIELLDAGSVVEKANPKQLETAKHKHCAEANVFFC